MSNSNLFKEIEKPLTQILDLDELKEKIDLTHVMRVRVCKDKQTTKLSFTYLE